MKKLFAFRSHYQKIKSFYKRYERLLLPATLVVGFLLDYFTFTNIQVRTSLILLFVYWFLALLAITFVHIYDAGKLSEKLKYIRLFAPLFIQLAFGALLGGAFIFYWFSGSISVSWPFILSLSVLMVSNEVFSHYFVKPMLQISVYFFITLSLFAVALPFWFNSLSPWLFVLAGALSLSIIGPYIMMLSVFSEYVKSRRLHLAFCVVGIFFVINFFYFANIIPPIPLSIREAGVYHSVQRSGGNYVLKGEAETFWQKIIPGQTLHLKPGARAYVYTAIFAPADLDTAIFHYWEYYDEIKKDWVKKDTLLFNIVGGRKQGFRGYSWKTNLATGSWRVYVKTQRGQVLGKVKFTVETTEIPADLMEIIR